MGPNPIYDSGKEFLVLKHLQSNFAFFRWLARLLSVVLLLGFTLTVHPGALWAEEASPPTPSLDEARTAFLKGRSLMDARKWREAGDEFAFASRAKNTPGLRYYVGFCREQEGLLVEALTHYREAEKLLADAPAADVEPLIPEAIRRVLSALPQVTFRGLPPAATLAVDGRNREITDRVALDPGTHTLRLRAPGYVDYETEVMLSRSSTEVIEVSMTPSPSSEPEKRQEKVEESDVESPHEEGSLRRVVFWSGVGVGSVGLGVAVAGGIGFIAASNSRSDALREVDGASDEGTSACFEPADDLTSACQQLADATIRRNTFRALLVAGGATAVVGAGVALVSHFFWSENPVRVTAMPVPGGTSLLVGGVF